MSRALYDRIRARIRDVQDFPKPGILFRDLTPVLEDPELFPGLVQLMVEPWKGKGIHKIAAIESRGFVFGAPMAQALGAGLALVRKAGKLPHKTYRAAYALEYGEAVVEIHEDSILKGEKVLVVDDLLATGGTARAAATLVETCGGHLEGYAFAVELLALEGAKKLHPKRVEALLRL